MGDSLGGGGRGRGRNGGKEISTLVQLGVHVFFALRSLRGIYIHVGLYSILIKTLNILVPSAEFGQMLYNKHL